MRLLYCYIECFRNIWKQEVKFANDYDIGFSHGMLRIRKEPNNSGLDYLYGDDALKNLTVIVGKTGAGKTNLLQLIGMQEYYRDDEDGRDAYFFLYELEPPRHFLLEVKNVDVDGIYSREKDGRPDFCTITFTIEEDGNYKLDEEPAKNYLKNTFIFNTFDSDSYSYFPYGETKEERQSTDSSLIDGIPREISFYGRSSVSIECKAIKDYLEHFPKESIKQEASFDLEASN